MDAFLLYLVLSIDMIKNNIPSVKEAVLCGFTA
jgi:hypothetical protein